MYNHKNCTFEDYNKAYHYLSKLRLQQITIGQIETPTLYIMYTKCRDDIKMLKHSSTSYGPGLATEVKRVTLTIQQELAKRSVFNIA